MGLPHQAVHIGMRIALQAGPIITFMAQTAGDMAQGGGIAQIWGGIAQIWEGVMVIKHRNIGCARLRVALIFSCDTLLRPAEPPWLACRRLFWRYTVQAYSACVRLRKSIIEVPICTQQSCNV